MSRVLPISGPGVHHLRITACLLAVALLGAACGSSTPAANQGDLPFQSDGSPSTSSATSNPSVVDVASSGETTTTSSSTTSAVAPVPASSFDVVEEIDRKIVAADIVIAGGSGRFLATAVDLEGLGCEGGAPEYYVVVGAGNDATEVQLVEGERTYAGYPTISPNRRQVLDVGLCEGFLGAVVLYDITADLQMSSVTQLNTGGSVSGDATWTSDGFIAMYLSAESPFIADSPSVDSSADGDAGVDEVTDGEGDGSQGGNGTDAGEQTGTAVDEFLVNPRTGERTQSGSLDQFHHGAVRLPNGRLVYTAYGIGSSPEVAVVVGDRGGAPIDSYPAGGFAISPDADWMLVWDWVFDPSEEITIDLVNLETGEAKVLAAGGSLQARWSPNSERVAFSNGLETYVYDLPTGDMITVGSVEPIGCEGDAFVVWGRVPMAFAADGDLYVGDAMCGESDDGLPFDHYRVHQIILS